MTADVITSAANPLLKDIRRAQERGGLTSQGWLIAEGPRLVEEAAHSGLRIRALIVSRDAAVAGVPSDRIIEVPANVFRSLAGTETPQGVLALVEPPAWKPDSIYRFPALVVVLDGVQEPGNVGAIARSAEAFGASGLVLLPGCANPFNPKALRSSAGSLFRLPFLRTAHPYVPDLSVFASVPFSAAPVAWDCDFTAPCALVIGSEGHGVSEDILRMATTVRIPTTGVESLNAAMAASILLYEAARQRRGV